MLFDFFLDPCFLSPVPSLQHKSSLISHRGEEKSGDTKIVQEFFLWTCLLRVHKASKIFSSSCLSPSSSSLSPPTPAGQVNKSKHQSWKLKGKQTAGRCQHENQIEQEYLLLLLLVSFLLIRGPFCSSCSSLQLP